MSKIDAFNLNFFAELYILINCCIKLFFRILTSAHFAPRQSNHSSIYSSGCKNSQNFQKSVVLWLNKLRFGIDALNEVDIMLGHTTCKTRHWTLLNHIIVIGKQILFYNSQKKTLSFLSHPVLAKKNIWKELSIKLPSRTTDLISIETSGSHCLI